MLKIIKQGRRIFDKKEALKFKCPVCQCVFQTDDYSSIEIWLANKGERVEHLVSCPNCDETVSLLMWCT